jgi:hypothetical protein
VPPTRASYTACTSPGSYSGLSEGSHTLEVKATDQASNTDPTPASRIWTVDTTTPETTIDSGPADGATLSSGDVSFTFSSSEAGSTFECSLDSAAYTECTSPKDYTDLSEGSHTFEVRATDGAGNVDPTPAVLHYSVEVPPPDTDGDMIPDSLDNCPTVANATQADADGDGTGDACDSQDNRDTDGDGIQNYQDDCPDVVGPVSNNGCPVSSTNPFLGIRWYPVMGVYRNASDFVAENALLDTQYANYVGSANENAYLDLNDGYNERYWFCGGRKYRWADLLVDETLAPSSRAQAQDPNSSNYAWNTNDHIDKMLDNSTAVAQEKAKLCLFVAFSATSVANSVPQFMIDDPDNLTWADGAGDHGRMDKAEALQQTTDFFTALLKRYGADERIASLTIGEYFPGPNAPTGLDMGLFRANMKIFWSDIIAAAPRDASGERMLISQSNPITTGREVTTAELRTIGLGVTGSDPNLFTSEMTETNLKALYGRVPTSHLANANRFMNNYQITWDGTPNPWGYTAGTTNTLRYEYLTWYHGSQGPTPLDSLMMTDNATLQAQWHEGYQQNGPNGSLASVWGAGA